MVSGYKIIDNEFRGAGVAVYAVAMGKRMKPIHEVMLSVK